MISSSMIQEDEMGEKCRKKNFRQEKWRRGDDQQKIKLSVWQLPFMDVCLARQLRVILAPSLGPGGNTCMPAGFGASQTEAELFFF